MRHGRGREKGDTVIRDQITRAAVISVNGDRRRIRRQVFSAAAFRVSAPGFDASFLLGRGLGSPWRRRRFRKPPPFHFRLQLFNFFERCDSARHPSSRSWLACTPHVGDHGPNALCFDLRGVTRHLADPVADCAEHLPSGYRRRTAVRS